VPITCPKCHFGNPDDTAFCGKCGTQLPPPQERPSVMTETLRAPVHELTTGSTFAGRYQVIEELGHGGMGRVYKVQDTKIGEKIALKLIRPEAGLDKKSLERFSNEIKLARKIRHKNVCQMFDLGEDQGTRYITMEYVHGEDLKQLIRKVGRLSPGQAVGIARQVCDGLEEAHRLGVVHRDLKPQNIMVDEDGTARIMDFGIARSLSGKSMTGAGVLIGTPEYMSPEQVEGKDVDQKSDIYSLGIILYEMLTGQVPFEGDTPFTVGIKQKSERPRDPRELNDQISSDLSGVILKCLEKAREKRYADAEELNSDLAKIEQRIPTREQKIPLKKAPTSRTITVQFGLRKAVVGGLVLISIVVIGIAAWRLLSGRRGPKPLGTPSVAVLPFEDMSPQKDQEYFCDGLTDELINRLSNIKELRVPARTSAFFFKGKTQDIQEIGQKLKVGKVLGGSVRKAGDKLRITAQLINIADGYPIWSETYNRELKDVFSVQDEIAIAVADKLKLTLLGDEKAKLVKRPLDNVEAYELYLRASRDIERFREDALDRALQYLQNGVDLVGDNALLYSAMAYVFFQYVNIGAKQEDYVAKAEEYARKALALEPDFPKAQVVLGLVNCAFKGNQQQAVWHFKKALSVSPNDPQALIWLADVCGEYVGKGAAAHALLDRLTQVDPLNPDGFVIRGLTYLYEARFDLALEQFRKSNELDPGNIAARACRIQALVCLKKLDEAFTLIDQFTKEFPGHGFAKFALACKYGLSNNKDALFREMTSEFQKTCRRDASFSQSLAGDLALVGARGEALDWLENAVNRGFINYPFLAEKNPWLANIRGEERFKKLMVRVKYDWEHFEE
jgi:serine/threonine protein kinase/tetratricopeptide (TPR) repeat protein